MLSGGELMPRYPTHMTGKDWLIAWAIACPFALFFGLLIVLAVFG